MNPVVLVLLAIGGIFAMKGLSNAAASASPAGGDPNPSVTRQNSWNLPDIDSSLQGGSWDQTFDESFEKASGATGVPFALIKAHAIRESALKPDAYHYDNPTSGASYGLLQTEWNYGSDRFAEYGFPDADIGSQGDRLYDPDTSAVIGANIIRKNLDWLQKGRGLSGLRDSINSYNTGTSEAKHAAPNHYVDDVLKYYAGLIGQEVTC